MDFPNLLRVTTRDGCLEWLPTWNIKGFRSCGQCLAEVVFFSGHTLPVRESVCELAQRLREAVSCPMECPPK